MTKIAFVADIHLDNHSRWGGPMDNGVNQRARDIASAFEHAQRIAHGKGCSRVVVAGDVFHRSTPSPALLQLLFRSVKGPPVDLLVGNHDLEGPSPHHHSLMAAAATGFYTGQRPIEVVDFPISSRLDDAELFLVPFVAEDTRDYLLSTFDQSTPHQEGELRVLVLHAGLSDSATPYYLDGSHGSLSVKWLAKFCKAIGVQYVFSGDWHRHQIWEIDGVTLCQIGALTPSRFPPNYEHGGSGPMVILDTLTGDIEVVDVPGPRFYKFRWSTMDKDWALPSTAQPGYLKITCRTTQQQEVKEWLEAKKVEHALTGRAWVRGVEIDLDRGVEQAKAKTAAHEARQASSLEEAIHRYVNRMPLPEGVGKGAVKETVQRLLG